MTPTLSFPAAPPRRQLLAATVLAVAAHALLLLGLPHLGQGVRAGMQGTAFVTRLVAPPARRPEATPPPPAPQPEPPQAQAAPPPAPTAERPRPPVPRPTARPRPKPAETPPTEQASFSAKAAGGVEPEPSLLGPPPLASFGGKNAPQPITPPLPTDEARATLDVAAEAGDAPAQVAPAAELGYLTSARIGGQAAEFATTLNWRQDGRLYDAKWALYSPRFGEHTRVATGLLAPQGLVPVEAALRTPEAQTMRFDYPARQLHFSATGADAPLRPGAQDRLSVLLQLGALLAGDARRYPVGTVIELPAAHPHGPGTWRFAVQAEEPVAAMKGRDVPALRLVHAPENAQDARVEVWLGRTVNYLPVRVRITEPNGDTVEHTLQTAYTQSVPLSPVSAPAAPASAPAQ